LVAGREELMGYNYLTLTKRKDEIPTKNCWISFTKEISKPTPENGKKHCTKEVLNQYNETVKHHKETMDILESGHVLLHNRSCEPDSLHNLVSDLFHENGELKSKWFRIEPLQNISKKESYTSRCSYQISEFDIVSEVKNTNDVINQVIKDDDTDEFLYEVFGYGQYSNERYRERAIEIFNICNIASKTKPKLSDMVYEKFDHYEKLPRYRADNKGSHELALYLLDNGLLDLIGEYDLIENLFNVLLCMKWTDIALRVIEYINNHTELDYEKQWIINDKEICKKISLMNDDANIQKIMSMLNIKSDLITLVVKEDIDDGYDERIVETVNFEDMNSLRSYLVTKYKVPFDMACKDVDKIWMDEDSEFYGYHFRIDEEK
jgi:hypothetical protein